MSVQSTCAHGPRGIRAAAALLAVALAWPAPASADPWHALTAEALPQSMQGYAQRALEQARAGDITMRAGIVFGLLSEHQAERARPLLLDTYRNLPEADGETDGDRLLAAHRQHLALRLAHMLFEGEGGPVDLEAGVAVLVPLARGGMAPAIRTLRFMLETTPQLPQSPRVLAAWEQLETDGALRSHADLAAAEDPGPDGVPEASAFSACTGWLAEGPRLLQSVRDAEAAALHDPQNAQSRLGAALAAAHAFDPAPAVGLGQFSLDLLPARALLYLVAEDMGLNLHFAPTVPLDRQASVWLRDYPRTLVVAELLDRLGWRARCADDWVLIEPDPARPASPGTPHPMLLGPVLSVEPPAGRDGAASGEIVWLAGTRYGGEIRAGLPHGRGRLEFITGSRLSADFRDGVAHGDGLYQLADGSEIYRGGFVDGHRHGRGQLGWFDPESERYLATEARFERGHRVEGDVQLASAAGADTAVTYRGPLRMDMPHGRGECSAGAVRYRCGFVDGDLVEIGGVGLYPKPD